MTLECREPNTHRSRRLVRCCKRRCLRLHPTGEKAKRRELGGRHPRRLGEGHSSGQKFVSCQSVQRLGRYGLNKFWLRHKLNWSWMLTPSLDLGQYRLSGRCLAYYRDLTPGVDSRTSCLAVNFKSRSDIWMCLGGAGRGCREICVSSFAAMDRGGRYLRLDTGFVPIGAAVHEIRPIQVGTPVASLVSGVEVH